MGTLRIVVSLIPASGSIRTSSWIASSAGLGQDLPLKVRSIWDLVDDGGNAHRLTLDVHFRRNRIPHGGARSTSQENSTGCTQELRLRFRLVKLTVSRTVLFLAYFLDTAGRPPYLSQWILVTTLGRN
jgi:hypothetical protein